MAEAVGVTPPRSSHWRWGKHFCFPANDSKTPPCHKFTRQQQPLQIYWVIFRSSPPRQRGTGEGGEGGGGMQHTQEMRTCVYMPETSAVRKDLAERTSQSLDVLKPHRSSSAVSAAPPTGGDKSGRKWTNHIVRDGTKTRLRNYQEWRVWRSSHLEFQAKTLAFKVKKKNGPTDQCLFLKFWFASNKTSTSPFSKESYFGTFCCFAN